MIKENVKAGKLDLLGSFISLACAVHCLVFPLLISLGSLVFLSSYTHELTESFILLISVSLCLWSLISSYQHHKRMIPLTFLALGIVSIILAKLFHSFSSEIVLNTIGALFIASAHLLNRRLVRLASTLKLSLNELG